MHRDVYHHHHRLDQVDEVVTGVAPGSPLGDYVLIEPLARGGYGEVWRAERRAGVGDVAIKILHAELIESTEAIARFRREAETIAAIDHRAVVAVEGFGETDDGRPYFAMELLDGVDLGALVRIRGALPAAEILEILEPVCDALDRAHALGIVHRDLKPSNIVACDGRVVLLDFGVAKILETAGPALTASRMTIGTPACMAPEQIRGEAVDARTDVYGLGALAYQLLTGAPAFAGAAVTLAYMHLHGRRPRPSAVVPATAPFDPVIARALARDRDERYPSAGAFFEAMREAAGGERSTDRGVLAPMLGALVDISVDPGALEDRRRPARRPRVDRPARRRDLRRGRVHRGADLRLLGAVRRRRRIAGAPERRGRDREGRRRFAREPRRRSADPRRHRLAPRRGPDPGRHGRRAADRDLRPRVERRPRRARHRRLRVVTVDSRQSTDPWIAELGLSTVDCRLSTKEATGTRG
jgi:predicted Ser/Thr protein kinase